METAIDHCSEHVLKYMPIRSICALSVTSKSMHSFVKRHDEVWDHVVPCGMAPFATSRHIMHSIGRASNMMHGRSVPNCEIATDRVVHVAEYNRRFFLVTQSLAVYVSDDRGCHEFYWYTHCANAGVSPVLGVTSCGADLFACSLQGVRWLSLDSSTPSNNTWSVFTWLPFPITRISVEVPGHAYMLLSNGTIGHYQYSRLGTDRESTYFTIRPAQTSATHIVALQVGEECMVGCTDKYVTKLSVLSDTEHCSCYSDADDGDSIESMVLIKPSGNVAVLFKNFHLCIINTQSMRIRRVGLVPFVQAIPVCMASHGNNVHVFPYCQQFTYSDTRDVVEMTNPLHGRIVTSCIISEDCSTAVLSCLVGEIFVVPLIRQ